MREGTSGQFRAQSRLGNWFPNHEGARRAYVDGIEVLQLFGEDGRPEGLVTADVDPSHKDHKCHAFPPLGGPCKLMHSQPEVGKIMSLRFPSRLPRAPNRRLVSLRLACQANLFS